MASDSMLDLTSRYLSDMTEWLDLLDNPNLLREDRSFTLCTVEKICFRDKDAPAIAYIWLPGILVLSLASFIGLPFFARRAEAIGTHPAARRNSISAVWLVALHPECLRNHSCHAKLHPFVWAGGCCTRFGPGVWLLFLQEYEGESCNLHHLLKPLQLGILLSASTSVEKSIIEHQLLWYQAWKAQL